MPSIFDAVDQKQKEIKQNRDNRQGNYWDNELRLNDGDEAYIRLAINPMNEDEPKFHWFYEANKESYSQSGKKFYQPFYVLDDGDTFVRGLQYAKRFAMWAYVYHVFHTPDTTAALGRKGVDTASWERVDEDGVVYFKENINDFRIVKFGFGREDSYWNQWCKIARQTKNKIHEKDLIVSRTGSQQGTTYGVMVALEQLDGIPAEAEAKIDGLQAIKEFYTDVRKRYDARNGTADDNTSAVDLLEDSTTEDELPW